MAQTAEFSIYSQKHGLFPLLEVCPLVRDALIAQGLVRGLAMEQPSDPLEFMIASLRSDPGSVWFSQWLHYF